MTSMSDEARRWSRSSAPVSLSPRRDAFAFDTADSLLTVRAQIH